MRGNRGKPRGLLPRSRRIAIPHVVAEVLVTALLVYGIAGVVFAVPFAWKGAGTIDPAAEDAAWGFRLLITPGLVALWPVMLLKWRRARRKTSAGGNP